MEVIRDSFVDLEKYRLQLEQNVEKLRVSLQLWQAWEIEYDGMREEILALGPVHTQAELESIGKQLDEPGIFAGQDTLLTQYERRQLLIDDKGTLRDSKIVIGLLSRRIDYVQQNIKTVSSLLTNAEEKNAASQVLSQPDVRNEEGLPLTEIYEELDEEGNVISSSTSEPGRDTPQMRDILCKTGVNLPEPSQTPLKDAQHAINAPEQTSTAAQADVTTITSPKPDTEIEQAQLSTSNSSESLAEKTKRRPSGPKKSVSFADGTKEVVHHSHKIDSPQERPREEIARIIKEIQEEHYAGIREAMPLPGFRNAEVIAAFGQKIAQLEKAREMKLKSAKVYQPWKRGFLEQFEDEEALSREQGGQIFADQPRIKMAEGDLQKEADLPGSSKSTPNSKATTDSNIPLATTGMRVPKSQEETSTLNGTSNIPGNPKTPVTHKTHEPVIPSNESPEDAALRRQMLQYNMDEVGAVVAELNLDEDDEFSDDHSEEDPDDTSSVDEDEDPFGRTKRRVLNNDYLAEMEALQKKMTNVGPDPAKGVIPDSNGLIQEDKSPNDRLINDATKLLKPGRKKSVSFADSLNIQEAPPPTPTKPFPQPHPTPKPTSNPILTSIIERPPTNPTTVPEPDEYNPSLLQKEVSTSYHKMRNHMIQRQGGFTSRNDERAEVPLSEAEGGPKKVSRFKAARLGRV